MKKPDILVEIEGKVNKTKLTVYAHNPKQTNGGDCYIVKLPSGNNVLIDTGHITELLPIKEMINSLGITKFEYCIITHGHSDHYGNLQSLLSAYDFTDCIFYFQAPIDKTRMPSGQVISYENCLKIFSDNSIGYVVPNNNEIIDVEQDVSFRFLNTDTSKFENYYGTTSEFQEEGITTLNNFSLVLEITHRNNKILFTGDIEEEAQNVLIDYIGKQSFITAPHHCTNTRGSDLFFDKVHPDIMRVSCAINQEFNGRANYIKALNYAIPTYISRYDFNGNNELLNYGEFISSGDKITTKSRTVYISNANAPSTAITVNSQSELISKIDNMNIGQILTCMVTNNVFNFVYTSTSAMCLIEKGTSLYAKVTVYNREVTNIQDTIYVGYYYNNVFNFTSLKNFDTLDVGVSILNGADLDTYTKKGIYVSDAAATTTSILHKPSDLTIGFRLEVAYMHVTSRLVQTIIPNDNGYFYKRNYTSAGWGNWYKYQGTQI